MKRLFFIIASGMLLLLSSNLRAGIIQFDGAGSGNLATTGYIEAGYRLTSAVAYPVGISLANGGLRFASGSSSGVGYSSVTLSKVDGGLFDFNSYDLIEIFNRYTTGYKSAGTAHLDVESNLGGFISYTQHGEIMSAGGPGFQSLDDNSIDNASLWNSISSAIFTAYDPQGHSGTYRYNSPAYTIDNLVLSDASAISSFSLMASPSLIAVSEPVTLALMGLGLFGLGISGRSSVRSRVSKK